MNDFKLPNDQLIFVKNDAWDSFPEDNNYLKEIKRLGLKGIIKPSDVTFLTIAHDAHCAGYKNKPCDCKPDIIDSRTNKVLNRRFSAF